MAKSLRATRTKNNKTALRAKVFAPVEQARNERLSAKLLELAKQPLPERTEMEVEKPPKQLQSSSINNDAIAEAMDLDGESNKKPSRKLSQRKKAGKVYKPSKRKAKNLITFPSRRNGGGIRKQTSKRKTR